MTGRGVPLVELRTTNELRFYTDSAGCAAIGEPGLMNQDVYFHVKSHGYEFPKDGFGYSGKKLLVVAGAGGKLKIKRINVAERLYRMTGEGIYRDTILLEGTAPIDQPLVNAQVMGQDSVHATPYRRSIFWIWGDTNRPSYPLGNFGVSGATSALPGPGQGRGLDPDVGVNLKYFTDKTGFSRPMIPPEAIPGPGPKWLGGLITIAEENNKERLIAKYVRMKNLGETLERGLVLFNDETESFERIVQFDLAAPLYLDGQPFRATIDGEEYFYCGYSPPYAVRVRANLKNVMDPTAYEGFTCLKAGTRFDKSNPQIDRGPDGKILYGWKRNTPPIGYDQQNEWIQAGKIKADEAWLQLTDVETGKQIKSHAGSVRWNRFRNRWVMIFEQAFGTSNLGEVWYAEADTPLGPWVYARKIVTHEKYTFYNPVHHAFFDQDGGRRIYFEGTYSDLFSGSPEKTPRYDYNQIMYRLNLDDPRLFLPAPVYEVRASGMKSRYLLQAIEESAGAWNDVARVAFFAMPPDRRREGMIPIFASPDGNQLRPQSQRAPKEGPGSQPLFYALPANAPEDELPPSVVPLYEYQSRNGADSGRRIYDTNPKLADESLSRSPDPICHVWRNPTAIHVLDFRARP